MTVGLGGAHGPRPLTTCAAYPDELDQHSPTVPAERRVLAAMGPRMLDLTAERTAGALPVLVTPEYTALARERLGAATLVVQQIAVVDGNPERARAAGRAPLEFLTRVPGYPKNMRRMAFADSDIDSLSTGWWTGWSPRVSPPRSPPGSPNSGRPEPIRSP